MHIGKANVDMARKWPSASQEETTWLANGTLVYYHTVLWPEDYRTVRK
jgi:hypothetical protein